MSLITQPLGSVWVTPAAAQADVIRNTVRNNAQQEFAGYKRLMELVYQNHAATKEEIVAELSQEEAVMLRRMACVKKAVLNLFSPGAIVDIIPEATIELPEELFPE